MATMNVSLPGPMKQWVEAQSADGRYSNASDYIRDLIRRDQERQFAELQAMINEGISSGVSERTREDILRAGRERYKARQGRMNSSTLDE